MSSHSGPHHPSSRSPRRRVAHGGVFARPHGHCAARWGSKEKEKTGNGDPLFKAPLLFIICKTKEAVDYLMHFDAGIIAEHIHLKAAELGLGSVILFGFIRHLGEDAEYIKMLDLPEGTLPLLAVAVGHAPGSDVKRKEDRHFKVISRD